MFPYRLKSNNPVYRNGMNAILATTSGGYTAVEIYHIDDTEDGLLVYRADDPTVGHAHSVQAEGTDFEIDLHDPIIALQILLRFVAIKGHGAQYYTEKRLRDELLLNDDNALDRRAHSLLSLLAEIDYPFAASPAKES